MRHLWLLEPMFPYKRRLTWLLKSRWLHLADAIHQHPSVYKGEKGRQIKNRVRSIRVWNTFRGISMLLLSAGVVASIALLIADSVQTTAEAETAARDAIRLFRSISSSLAGVAALLYLFATRILGQLEIDVLFLAGISRIRA